MYLRRLFFIFGLICVSSLFAQKPNGNLQKIYETAEIYWRSGYTKEAMSCWTEAAKAGHIESQYVLGKTIKEYYKSWYTETEEEREYTPWGHIEPIREKVITKEYEYSIQDAIYWLEKAALQNHVEAQFFLAECYDEVSNYDMEFYWYTVAKLNGHEGAQFELGKIYNNAGMFDMNAYKMVILLWEELAQKGNVEAQYGLGSIYKKRDAEWYNLEKTAYWYLKAAEQGHGMAQYQVGKAYCEGWWNFEKSLEKSVYWLKKAATNGISLAKSELKKLGKD